MRVWRPSRQRLLTVLLGGGLKSCLRPWSSRGRGAGGKWLGRGWTLTRVVWVSWVALWVCSRVQKLQADFKGHSEDFISRGGYLWLSIEGCRPEGWWLSTLMAARTCLRGHPESNRTKSESTVLMGEMGRTLGVFLIYLKEKKKSTRLGNQTFGRR